MYDINFNPNDGVHTTLKVAYEGTATPDYLVCSRDDIYVDSKWFVLEARRLLSGHYLLDLYRDLLADYWNDISGAPMYIEKAYVSIDDNAIFNPEAMTFDRIKEAEILIKDQTECPWIVGYYSLPVADKTETIKEIIDGDETTKETIIAGEPDTTTITFGGTSARYDIAVASLEDWPLYRYTTNPYKSYNNHKYTIKIYDKEGKDLFGNTRSEWREYTFNSKELLVKNQLSLVGPNGTEYKFNYPQNYSEYKRFSVQYAFGNAIINNMPETIDADFAQAYGLTGTEQEYAVLSSIKNSIIKVGSTNPQYKRVKLVETKTASVSSNVIAGAVYDDLLQLIEDVSLDVKAEIPGMNVPIITGTPQTGNFLVSYDKVEYKIELEDITPTYNFTCDISKRRKVLTDAPYCMFCMPYSDDFAVEYSGDNIELAMITSKENQLFFAMGIAKSAGAYLYDL